MSKYLMAASILAAATVALTGSATPGEAHYYSYAAYPYDCLEYNPNCVLYDYPYSTYYYSGYPYWLNRGGYWGGWRYWNRRYH